MPRADIISYWDVTSIHLVTKRSPPILSLYQPTLKMGEKRTAKAYLSTEFYNSNITTYNKSSTNLNANEITLHSLTSNTAHSLDIFS